jgi:O-antigen/teichoic acid export membrane protein
MSTLGRLSARPGVVMGLGRLVVAGLGILATPLLTRVLTPTEYGRVALAIAVVAMASTIPTQWLNAAVLRYGPSISPRSLERLIWRGLGLMAIPVSLVALSVAGPTFRGDERLILLVVLYAACETVFVTRWIAARALLRAWPYVVAGSVRNLVSVLLVATLYATGEPVGISEVLAAMIIASVLGSFAVPVMRKGDRDVSDEQARLQLWFRYGWPLIVNYGMGLAFAYVNRFMLLALSGPVAVGRFSPTYDLMFSIITLTVGLVGLTTVPRLFSSTEEAEIGGFMRQLRRNVALASVLVPTIILAAWPLISTLLIGEELRVKDPWFVTTLTLSFGLMAYRFQYLNIRAQLHERTGLQTLATGAGLGVNVLLNILLIPRYGLVGAGWATFAGAIAATSFLLFGNSERTLLLRERP